MTDKEDYKTWICRDCVHYKQGRCWKFRDVNGKGFRRSWNHICRSDDFVRRKENKQ